MSVQRKINTKTILAFIAGISLLIFTVQLTASKKNIFNYSFFNSVDTIPQKQKTKTVTTKTKLKEAVAIKIGSDTLPKKQKDSILINIIDTLNISKDSIDAPINYKASDSGVLTIPTKQFVLYGKANVQTKDMDLNAGVINYNSSTSMVKAYTENKTDTGSFESSRAVLVQGPTKTISDSILFNLKTLKGLTKNTYLQEGEMYINAQVLKKVNATDFYAFRGKFTTCNLDTPHFAIRTRKLKMVSNKLAVSGPASPEFEGVPIPLGIPFGIYPLTQGRHSGVLPPAFNVSEDFGLGLEGLGYYKVFSDYLDVTTRANIYSYGGYMINVNPKYIKKYRYQGGLNITYQSTKALNRNSYGSFTKEEFNQSKSFNVTWNHSQDQRVRPGTTFAANVNFGSTRFNTLVLNNPFLNFQNNLSSSINYTKDFRGKGNISVSANHSQNAVTRLVNVNLPTLNANVVTFFPFQKKDQVGSQKWYEKLGIGYSGNFTNQLSFYDSAINLAKLLDTVQWGATHSIPIAISLPSLGPITIAPGISYEEKWYGQKIIRTWNGKKVDTTITKGFFTARQMAFSIGANSRIFGTYQFNKNSDIVAIRHEMRPNIAVSYTPNLVNQYFYNVQIDSVKTIRVSQLDGVVPGAYSGIEFGGIGFGIDNLLEMKVKDKSDSTKPKATKKVKLIDGFGFNSAYNLMADSFALSPFTFYARSTLFEIFNITAGFTLDPYAVDSQGFRKNQLLFTANQPKIGRITTGNIAVSANFKSKPRDGKTDKERIPVDPFMTPDEQQQQLQFARSNPAEFTDFNIPWTIGLNYSLYYIKQLQPNYTFKDVVTSTVNFNGDFSLTEKWKMGGTGFFDFTEGRLQQLSMFITREMHCWQLSINVNPIGIFRSFNITINPKSGILRDLRINRSRSFSSQ